MEIKLTRRIATSLQKMTGMAGAISAIAIDGGAIEIDLKVLDLYGITENDLKIVSELYASIDKQK